ncbi:MAG TPA: acyl carrier protein [Gammaproteobacteria bacterium]|nr:acyl carrier protein [Gammaproteobacteria bacterium]
MKDPDAVRTQVLAVLATVAPEMDAATLDPQVNFRDQMDFDSMDFMTFAIGLHKAFGVDIPETDYPKLFSLAGCIAYFAAG